MMKFPREAVRDPADMPRIEKAWNDSMAELRKKVEGLVRVTPSNSWSAGYCEAQKDVLALLGNGSSEPEPEKIIADENAPIGSEPQKLYQKQRNCDASRLLTHIRKPKKTDRERFDEGMTAQANPGPEIYERRGITAEEHNEDCMCDDCLYTRSPNTRKEQQRKVGPLHQGRVYEKGGVVVFGFYVELVGERYWMPERRIEDRRCS